MTKAVNEQIKEKFYSLLNDGVPYFLKVDTESTELSHSKAPETSAPSALSLETLPSKIANCSACLLSQSSKSIVVPPKMLTKKYFVLSEFPSAEDENTKTKCLFSEKSSEGLILKLLDKLNILSNCHLSFAIKCLAEKGFAKNSLEACSHQNLFDELRLVGSDIILCFGAKALFSLAQLDKSLKLHEARENYSILNMHLGSSLKQIFYLSSSRDLLAFPHWRPQVWRLLEHLKHTDKV